MTYALPIRVTTPAPHRRKLSDELADCIRQHIIDNKLRINDRLPKEKELIEQLGASRATVREALKSLEVQGLIYNTTGPSGGARVADVSVDHAISLLRNFFYFNPIDARQLYQVRLQIEPELAASVVGRLDAGHFEALEANVRLQEQTPVSAETWRTHREAEVMFHDILAAACPNPLLALTARFINQVIRTTIDLTEPSTACDGSDSFTRGNISCHRRILKALRQGDAKKVRPLMTKHLIEAEPYVHSMVPRVEVMPPPAFSLERYSGALQSEGRRRGPVSSPGAGKTAKRAPLRRSPRP